MLAHTAQARLRYLDAAARLTAPTAPIVSSVLSVEANVLASNLNLPRSDSARSSICIACGGPLDRRTLHTPPPELANPRHTSSRRRRSSNKRAPLTHDKDQPAFASPPHINIACARCHRIVRLAKAVPGKRSSSNLGQSRLPGHRSRQFQPSYSPILPELSSAPTSDTGPLVKPNAAINAGSRKRAKARKHGGLHAILEKSKPIPAEASLLDLMDFMKND